MRIKYLTRRYYTPLGMLSHGELFTLGDESVQIVYARGSSYMPLLPAGDQRILAVVVDSSESDQVGLIVPMDNIGVMRVRRTSQNRFETVDNE